MTSRLGRIVVVVALAVALALTGCGRKGELEPPPETAPAAATT